MFVSTRAITDIQWVAHRCGLQAFEGGFCHPNDCIEGYELEHSETVCAGFLGDECVI